MSETDDQLPRRPPTIELAATEIDSSAEQPAAGETESASAAANEPRAEQAPAGSNTSTSRASGGRLFSLIASALIGAAVMATVAAVLWFFAVIPAREATPAASIASNMSSAASVSPNALSSPPPTAAAPDLAARLDRIERTIEAQRAEPKPGESLGSRVSELQAQTKSLADALAALTQRADQIAGTSQSAAKQADAALSAEAAAKSSSEAAGKNEAQRNDLDALGGRIMALESSVKGLAAATAPLTSSGADDRAARLTIAAETLRAAVERGAPFQAELAALQSLGVDAKKTEALDPFAASGVPSALALARELDALIPTLQDAAEPQSADATFLDRLKTNAQKLVRITPVNAPTGSEPQDVIDRIRRDAAQNDIAAALTDINALPDSAKPLAAAFTKKAAARAAALAAVGQIAADALAALTQSSNR
jgi:hypothetical protein